MDLKRAAQTGFLVVALVLANPGRVVAAPHFSLNPAAAGVTVGQTFQVIVGVDSELEKVIGIDVAASFDVARLSVESIEKGNVPSGGYNFSYTPDRAIIHNDTGKFELTLPSADSSVYNGVVAKHDLLIINLKAKAVGTAVLNFVCTAGLVTESNIINDKGADVIDCATNQSGSYTISIGAGGDTGATPTVGLASVVATPTTGSSELPRTGGFGPTVGLVIFGVVTVIAGWFLRFI